MTTDLARFSEQAAIDLVDFLVDVMCHAQQFSNRLPTVGGNIHIAILPKSGGFRWISKEEYTYKGRGVPEHDEATLREVNPVRPQNAKPARAAL